MFCELHFIESAQVKNKIKLILCIDLYIYFLTNLLSLLPASSMLALYSRPHKRCCDARRHLDLQ